MFNRGFGGFNHCLWFGNRFFFGGWGMLALAGIILAAGILIYLIMKSSHKRNASTDALERLKIRYVHGELSEEEFLQKKKVLEL